VWDLILANVKLGTEGRTAPSSVNPGPGDQTALNSVPVKMGPLVTLRLGSVPVLLVGWEQYVMNSVPLEGMDRSAKIDADVKMVVYAIMCQGPASVKKDGRVRYVTTHAHQGSMDQTVQILATVRTMEVAIQ